MLKSSVSTQTVSKNAAAKETDEPKKDGYTFDDRYLSNAFSEKYDFAARATKNLTLYAKWTEDKEPTEDKDNKPNDTDKHDYPSNDFKDPDINLWYHLDTDYVLSGGLMRETSAKTVRLLMLRRIRITKMPFCGHSRTKL